MNIRRFAQLQMLAPLMILCLAASPLHRADGREPPASQAAQPGPSTTQERIAVRTGEFKLPGALTLPEGDGPFPAVVLVHGSGPHDEDETIGPNKPFRDLAEGLAERGVATLRYAKRTLKYGMQMDVADITLKEEVIDDALSAVALLKAHTKIDARRIFVLGHSLGGTCAPLIGDRDKQIAGLILLSGTPRSLLDLVDEQFEYIFNVDGKITKKEAKTLEDIHRTTQLIREGRYDELKTPLLGAPTNYWVELHKLDVITPAKRFGRPMLIIGGGRDFQVTEKCFDAWKDGLRDCSNVTYKWYPKNNHLMMSGEGPCTPEEYMKPGHMSKKVIRDIAEWIKSPR